jgi:hypothetical protein
MAVSILCLRMGDIHTISRQHDRVTDAKWYYWTGLDAIKGGVYLQMFFLILDWKLQDPRGFRTPVIQPRRHPENLGIASPLSKSRHPPRDSYPRTGHKHPGHNVDISWKSKREIKKRKNQMPTPQDIEVKGCMSSRLLRRSAPGHQGSGQRSPPPQTESRGYSRWDGLHTARPQGHWAEGTCSFLGDKGASEMV